MPRVTILNSFKLKVKKLYLVLWGGTFIIGIALYVLAYQQDEDEMQRNKNPALTEQEPYGNAINDLLLSANDLTIEEKRSFINLYLKPGEDIEVTFYQKAKEKHTEIYKQILQRKLNKLNNKPSNDFSIGPIPK